MLGFKWILKDKLAAATRPGLYSDMDDDMNFLLERGINNILTLTETPLSIPDEYEVNNVHFAIDDMSIPLPRDTYTLLTEHILDILENGKLLVHCKAGLGRTGIILACIMIHRGLDAVNSVKYIRKINAAFIQNELQEHFIVHYEEFYKKQKIEQST